jgi:aminopeptidase N
MEKFLRYFSVIAIFLSLSEASLAQARSSGGPLSPNQEAFNVHYYDINLRVAMNQQAISGHVDLYIIPDADTLTKIELDLVEEYRISYIETGGRLTGFQRAGDKLFVHLTDPPAAGESFRVRVVYSGKPPVAVRPPWDGGFNWSKAPDGSHWVGVSCQGEGAQLWYPNVDHPSKRPDSASINVTVPEPYFVASNGLLESVLNHGTGFTTYRWKTRYPIHTYNINISIARYKRFEKPMTLNDGNTMPVVFYVLPDDLEKAEGLVDMAIDMLTRLGRYYGQYPFSSEKFGIVQTDYLGMEHQTINAYGNRFNYTRINGEEFDWLLLHEMGHEWWGNKITVTDWADFWIHEGITTYTDALYLWDRFGPEDYHAKFDDYRRRISNLQPVIPGEDMTSAEVYNLDLYYKGAYFMHSLRFLLGDEAFFKTLKAFTTDESRTYSNYTSTTDFRQFFEQHTGTELEAFFDLYLYTTDLPQIEIGQTAERQYQISIPNISFSIPMDVAIGGTVQRMLLGPEPVQVSSPEPPVVDPQNWYLKSDN